MKKLFLVILSLMVCGEAFALPVGINRRDVKFPTQQMVEKQTILNPAAAGTNQIVSASDGNTSAAADTITVFAAQPDVPRNLVITPATSSVDIANCNIVVNGTDISGNTIAESFAFSNNQSAAWTGSLAFKTVTSIVFPANCEDGAFATTWSVGYGEKLGIKRCMDSVGHFLFSTIDGTKEATAPTIAVGSSIAGNTADFNGTMNGTSDFELFFFQNFTCF